MLPAGKTYFMVPRSAIHAIYALDGDEHAALALPQCSIFVPKRTERSTQRAHIIIGAGTAHARCDARGTGTVVDRGMDGLIVEEGTA